jgi:hypothetical protein
VFQSPVFSARLLRVAATGWEISPIVRITSAQEFTVTSGTDVALTTMPGQTPNLVSQNPYPRNQTPTNWINAPAFAAAAPGTYGNLGYNNLRGPAFFTLDMSLVRSFRIREGMALQLRGEGFNLPNRANFNTPVATLNSGNFGQIITTGANGPRIIQLAAKFVF